MNQFDKFKEKFYSIFKDVDEFFYELEDYNKNPLNGELKEDEDQLLYDSYGNEDSKLKRVYYFSEFDIFVKFLGTRQSHVGTEWQNMLPVKPVVKTINTYE